MNNIGTAQCEIVFRSHGGRRRGAGRKPKGPRAGVSHGRRPALRPSHPALVTMKVRQGLWSLRSKGIFNRIWHALRRGCDRFGFRVVHFSVQRDHVHLLVEAADQRALSRGMQGLNVRIARAINGVMERKGKVFADRYHQRVLTSPKQTRHAINYVLSNAKKHGIGARARGCVDAMSSAPWFSGWASAVRWSDGRWTIGEPPIAPAQTWLMKVGWMRGGGSLDPDRIPGPPARAAGA